jgi:excisionase family DNA binding protein
MRELVTPKQVARAINVSESSVKRWCDKGIIPTQYTAGGHRRIPLSGLMEFLRSSTHDLADPEVLGLPATSGRSRRMVVRAAEQMTQALLAGNEPLCRQIALDLYLAEHSLSRICDDVLAVAFRTIGERWQCGEAEIYQERRGCEVTLRILHDLRVLVATPPPGAPLAIGAAAAGDQYVLGTAMAELILRDVGWQAISLGTNLPFQTLSAAIRERRPQLFWLSCTHIENEKHFLASYNDLYDEYGLDVAFVVGGRALSESLRQRMRYAAFCDNMQHLESFAQSLRSAYRPESA